MFDETVSAIDFEDHERIIDEKKQAALSGLMDAWQESHDSGIDTEILAQASLFMAVSQLVTIYGEDAVSDMMVRLPKRIQNGEFSLERSLQ